MRQVDLQMTAAAAVEVVQQQPQMVVAIKTFDLIVLLEGHRLVRYLACSTSRQMGNVVSHKL